MTARAPCIIDAHNDDDFVCHDRRNLRGQVGGAKILKDKLTLIVSEGADNALSSDFQTVGTEPWVQGQAGGPEILTNI